MDHIRRDQTPQFSQPLSQILTMLAIVGGVVGLGYLAYPSVGPTFWANPYLNAFILFVFLTIVLATVHIWYAETRLCCSRDRLAIALPLVSQVLPLCLRGQVHTLTAKDQSGCLGLQGNFRL